MHSRGWRARVTLVTARVAALSCGMDEKIAIVLSTDAQ
jgi:hypothetical protein